MQSSSPRSDVINYLAIDPGVWLPVGPPSHIHQACRAAAKPGWKRLKRSHTHTHTHTLALPGLRLRQHWPVAWIQHTVVYDWMEPGGMRFAPTCLSITCHKFHLAMAELGVAKKGIARFLVNYRKDSEFCTIWPFLITYFAENTHRNSASCLGWKYAYLIGL